MAVVYIEDIARHVGQQVTVRGWLRHRRSSGKIHFLVVRDGTGELQAVVSKGTVGEEQFAQSAALTQESSLVLSDRPPSGSDRRAVSHPAQGARSRIPHGASASVAPLQSPTRNLADPTRNHQGLPKFL